MKKLPVILLAFSLFASFPLGIAFAQTSSSEGTSSVAFPIAELGNCSSISECKEYCNDPINKDICIAYAKEKGFYNEEKLESKKDEILQKAASELGCTTKEECKEMCALEENLEKCSSFAKKYSLPGGKNTNSESASTLKKAQASLGCTTKESCKAVCELEENVTKCSEFAKVNNLSGGVKKTGPGGCTSEETCKAYCEKDENRSVCSEYGFIKKKSFVGPGGCSTAEACKTYCLENPTECQAFDTKRKEEKEKIEADKETEVANEEEKETEHKDIETANKESEQQRGEQEKRSIFQIFKFGKDENESEKIEPSTTPKPTPKITPKVERTTEKVIKKVQNETSNSSSTPAQFKNQTPSNLLKHTKAEDELNKKIEYCMQKGCIWKENYCNCAYKITPTPVKSGSTTLIKPSNQTSSSVVAPSAYPTQTEEYRQQYYLEHKPTPTPAVGTSANSSSVQGISTSEGIFGFFRSLFR